MKLAFSYVRGQFAAAMEDRYRPIAVAAKSAVTEAGQIALVQGRRSIAAAGGRFGKGWQNSLRLLVFPRRGISASPAALVYHKIFFAGVFERGATIAGKPLMWVPLKTSPTTIGRRKLTPQEFIAKVAPLYLIRPPGKPPLLVAKIAAKTQKGRQVVNVNLAALRRGAKVGGRTVPIFVGIETAKISKRFGVEAAAKRAAALLPALYSKYLKDN